METDALVTALASDLKPVRRHALGRRLLAGLIGGGAITLAIVACVLGFRSDLANAMHGFAFWMKWGYTLSLGVCAIAIVARLARPEPVRLREFWPVAIPVALLAAIGIVELAQAPSGDWLGMWLGRTWTKCPWIVLMLSAPIFLGLLWSFRRMAPTRLRAAGAAAGLAAGAWAATLYCLHCPEVSALFVLTWYTLGIALPAVIGALLGPCFLRW